MQGRGPQNWETLDTWFQRTLSFNKFDILWLCHYNVWSHLIISWRVKVVVQDPGDAERKKKCSVKFILFIFKRNGFTECEVIHDQINCKKKFCTNPTLVSSQPRLQLEKSKHQTTWRKSQFNWFITIHWVNNFVKMCENLERQMK